MNLLYYFPSIIGLVVTILGIFSFLKLKKSSTSGVEIYLRNLKFDIALLLIALINFIVAVFIYVERRDTIISTLNNPQDNSPLFFDVLIPAYGFFSVLLLLIFNYRRFRFLRSDSPRKEISIWNMTKDNQKASPNSSKFNLLRLVSRLFVITFVLLCVVVVYQFIQYYAGIQKVLVSISQIDGRIIYSPPKSTLVDGVPDALTTSFLTLIVVAVGTLSTQILAWRTDKRSRVDLELKENQFELAQQEANLKIKILELELSELKKKQDDSTKLITEGNQEALNKLQLSPK